MEKLILETNKINKYFHDPVTNQVLKEVSFSMKQREFVSVVGKSGCGKSTLLYILSTMDTEYEGDLILDGVSMQGKSDEELSRVRNEKIGFVFQFHYLLPEFSVLQNVMMPGLKLAKHSAQEVESNAIDRLKSLGIDHLAAKRASQISGGEKQRVAIARALINNPLIIMGDEPTGNLDHKNSDIVFDIFHQLAEETGQSLLIVTHDHDFASRTDRIIEMDDGRIVNH
ncbi:ABC transporter ATP-binding protein [Daejeonella oryzae]|uniref:ABC transporter ATP-binding protein n=1 Tax=Daejeonella oryzae TaxID=1122943 RepID=UPI000423B179|nr:ABC transporter ATP-binding protein [Daejeonella oryzae]